MSEVTVIQNDLRTNNNPDNQEILGDEIYETLENFRRLLIMAAIFFVSSIVLQLLGLFDYTVKIENIIISAMLWKVLSLAVENGCTKFSFSCKIAGLNFIFSIISDLLTIRLNSISSLFFLYLFIIIIILSSLFRMITILSIPLALQKIFKGIHEKTEKSWITVSILWTVIIVMNFAIEIIGKDFFTTTTPGIIIAIAFFIMNCGIFIYSFFLIRKSQKALISISSEYEVTDADFYFPKKTFILATCIAFCFIAVLTGARIFLSTIPAKKTLNDAYKGINQYSISIGIRDTAHEYPVVSTLDEILNNMEKESFIVLKVNRSSMKPISKEDFKDMTLVQFWPRYFDLYGTGLLSSNVWKMQDYEVTLADGETVYATYAVDLLNKLGDGEIELPISYAYKWSDYNEFRYEDHITDSSERDLTKIHICGNDGDKFIFEDYVIKYDNIFIFLNTIGFLILAAGCFVWKTYS